jgi:carbonic anhydrase
MKQSLLLLYFLVLPGFSWAQITAAEALNRLKTGNERFYQGKAQRPNQSPERVKALAGGQNPFAIIVGCSDSRVPNEIIFDQGLGDLFIVRTAGQVSTFASWGSIEFANAVLGAKLIVVLGHTECGAVAAACKVPDVPGHIVTLINAIKPAAEATAHQSGNRIDNAVRANVAMQVAQLKSLEPVLSKAVASGNTQIIGAVYHLSDGRVEFLPDNYLNTIPKP